MKFNYPHEGVKTVEQALMSGLISIIQGCGPDIIDPAWVRSQADELLEELRGILTGELATLFDDKGVATEWNDAVEMSIRVVEGTAP